MTLQKLSKLARRWASFLAEVLRMEYENIDCTIDELTRNEYRVNGQTASTRSCFRALAELEAFGAIHRTKLRLGDNRFRVHIALSKSWFEWILKGRAYCPTSTHINSQLPKWQEVPRTDSDLTIPNHSLFKERKELDTKQTKEAKKHRYHPVIYSLMKVLGTSKDRNTLLYRADYELNPKNRATSGIDWTYYSAIWQILEIPHREKLALEISDMLRSATERPSNVVSLSSVKRVTAEKSKNIGETPMENGEIQKIGGLDFAFALCVSPEELGITVPNFKSVPVPTISIAPETLPEEAPSLLTHEELRILTDARNAAALKAKKNFF